LSTRSWGFKPSLLSGFITFVGGVHIIYLMGFQQILSIEPFMIEISFGNLMTMC